MDDAMGPADPPVARVDCTLEPLIPRFLERRRNDAAAIESLVSAGDWTSIKSMGHSIKGSGGGYGFDPITEMGAAIEAAADAGDGLAAIEVARRMQEYVDAVRIEYVDE